MFLAPVTQWYNTTREPKIKYLNPATGTRSKKMRKSRVFTWLCHGSTVVEHLPYKQKIQGSNPATGIWK